VPVPAPVPECVPESGADTHTGTKLPRDHIPAEPLLFEPQIITQHDIEVKDSGSSFREGLLP